MSFGVRTTVELPQNREKQVIRFGTVPSRELPDGQARVVNHEAIATEAVDELSDVHADGRCDDYLYRDRETRDPEAIFRREAAACRWIREHLEPGIHRGPVRVTGEFSYRAAAVGGDGFCVVGDAYSFLDPVFASGVFVALKSGELAADAICAALVRGEDVTAATFDNYSRDIRYVLDSFRKIIIAFYDRTFRFSEFLGRYPHLEPRLVNLLVGNVSRDLDPLFEALAEHSRRSRAVP